MARTTRPRRRWSDDEKRQIVSEFEQSELPIHGYAKRHDLGESNLRKWIERFGSADSGSAPFVELKGLLSGGDRSEYDYELTLVSGHTLRLRRGFDSGDVQALVAALGR